MCKSMTSLSCSFVLFHWCSLPINQKSIGAFFYNYLKDLTHLCVHFEIIELWSFYNHFGFGFDELTQCAKWKVNTL